jgi:predicted RNase H-like nuclease (RuvC/YqgF family)
MDETIDRHKEPLSQEISSINEKLEQEKKKSKDTEEILKDAKNKINRLSQQLNEKLEQEKKKSKDTEEILKDAKNKINRLSQQLNENSVRITEQEIEISSMKDSITYQLTSKFHNCFIERLLPDRGKDLYKLGLKGGRILVNEGVKSFWWNFNNYLQDKKKRHKRN